MLKCRGFAQARLGSIGCVTESSRSIGDRASAEIERVVSVTVSSGERTRALFDAIGRSAAHGCLEDLRETELANDRKLRTETVDSAPPDMEVIELLKPERVQDPTGTSVASPTRKRG